MNPKLTTERLERGAVVYIRQSTLPRSCIIRRAAGGLSCVVKHDLQPGVYAGAYAFGKAKTSTKVMGGRARKTVGHKKSRLEWTVLIPNHHPGYIAWEEYEHNQAVMAANVQMKSLMEPKAGGGGRALLSGLLRCRRCGHMLYVSYSGQEGMFLRYQCKEAHMRDGSPRCLNFSGTPVDRAVADEVL